MRQTDKMDAVGLMHLQEIYVSAPEMLLVTRHLPDGQYFVKYKRTWIVIRYSQRSKEEQL